jgi:ribonuclease HI
MKIIEIFTDGATPNNQFKGNRIGGVGVFFSMDDDRNLSFKLKETKYLKVTNNVCELTACLMGIQKLITTQDVKGYKIIIYSDSAYVINSITKWCKGWEKRGWIKSDGKPVDNLEIIQKIYYLYLNFNIEFIHVRSHKAEPKDKNSKEYFIWFGNYMADKLATDATK